MQISSETTFDAGMIAQCEVTAEVTLNDRPIGLLILMHDL